jgi:hypothetical protein
MLDGRSRNNTPKSSIVSGVSMASNGVAGSAEACRSPRATPRISSRSSLSDLRIIVVLLQLFQFNLFNIEIKRDAFGFARSFNGHGSSGISPSEGGIHPSLKELNPILPFCGFYHLLRISIEHVRRSAIRQSQIGRYQPQRQPPAVGVRGKRMHNLCDNGFRPSGHRIKLKMRGSPAFRRS